MFCVIILRVIYLKPAFLSHVLSHTLTVLRSTNLLSQAVKLGNAREQVAQVN